MTQRRAAPAVRATTAFIRLLAGALLLPACGDSAGEPTDEERSSIEAGVPDGSDDDGNDPSKIPLPGADGASDEPDAGRADAGPLSSDAGPTSFCADRAGNALCEDFEDGLLEGYDWTELTNEAANVLSVVDDGDRPGGYAMRAALTGIDEESARWVVRLQNEAALVHIAFDIDTSFEFTGTPGEDLVWVKIQQEVEGGYPGISLVSRKDASFVIIRNAEQNGAVDQYLELPPLPTGWVNVAIDAALTEGGTLEVSYDGETVLKQTGLPLTQPGLKQTTLQLGLYTQVVSSASALYDNLVIDYPVLP